jgi:hypothetical protein
MRGRSRKGASETAHAAVLAAADDLTGPEILAELVGSPREGIEEGASDLDLALRLWPRLSRVLTEVMAEHMKSPAASLGRRGGQKGRKGEGGRPEP